MSFIHGFSAGSNADTIFPASSQYFSKHVRRLRPCTSIHTVIGSEDSFFCFVFHPPLQWCESPEQVGFCLHSTVSNFCFSPGATQMYLIHQRVGCSRSTSFRKLFHIGPTCSLFPTTFVTSTRTRTVVIFGGRRTPPLWYLFFKFVRQVLLRPFFSHRCPASERPCRFGERTLHGQTTKQSCCPWIRWLMVTARWWK